MQITSCSLLYRSQGPDPPKRERRLQTDDGRMLNVNEPKSVSAYIFNAFYLFRVNPFFSQGIFMLHFIIIHSSLNHSFFTE